MINTAQITKMALMTLQFKTLKIIKVNAKKLASSHEASGIKKQTKYESI